MYIFRVKLSEIISSPALSQSVPTNDTDMEHFVFPKGRKILHYYNLLLLFFSYYDYYSFPNSLLYFYD